jgi:hypothetical protein
MGKLLRRPLLQWEQKLVWMTIQFFEYGVASIGTDFSILVLFGHNQLDSQPVAIPTKDFVHI